MSRPAGGGEAPRRVVISLGSNLGDRLAHLRAGAAAVLTATGVTPVAVSPVFETAPVGGPPQPAYLNAVVITATELPPRAVLEVCQRAETAAGRVRAERWGPRTLDADIIVYGDVVSDSPDLMLPHPRAHQRAFVLAPWLAADPVATLPGRGDVAGLLAAAGHGGVRELDGVTLWP